MKDTGVDAPPTVAEAPKVVINTAQLEKRDGLMYFDGKPYTGVAVDKYRVGKWKMELTEESTWKDGKFDGPLTKWYENGQKQSIVTLKNRKMNGPVITWYENGQKFEEGTYRDNKLHGLQALWYENGQKNKENTYKDGKLLSATIWKHNGEKCPDTNLVDGSGIVCSYHENGQKKMEITRKDGKQISSKSWHENGQKKGENTYNENEISGKEWDKDGNLIKEIKDSRVIFSKE